MYACAAFGSTMQAKRMFVTATPEGGRKEEVAEFRPFLWLGAEVSQAGIQVERLKGDGAFNWLAHADTLERFELFFKEVREGTPVDVLRPFESQWLLQRRTRLYAELSHLVELRRCQLDIETPARPKRGRLVMQKTPETGCSQLDCSAASGANCWFSTKNPMPAKNDCCSRLMKCCATSIPT